MGEKFRFYAAAFLILKKDSKYLLSLRQNTGHEDGNYGFIAGHLDGGETAKAAIIREAYEEIGIRISPDNIHQVHIMHRNSGDREYFDNFFMCEEWDGEIENKEPEKCGALDWFDVSTLPENFISYDMFILDQIAAGNSFSDVGFEV